MKKGGKTVGQREGGKMDRRKGRKKEGRKGRETMCASSTDKANTILITIFNILLLQVFSQKIIDRFFQCM